MLTQLTFAEKHWNILWKQMEILIVSYISIFNYLLLFFFLVFTLYTLFSNKNLCSIWSFESETQCCTGLTSKRWTIEFSILNFIPKFSIFTKTATNFCLIYYLVWLFSLNSKTDSLNKPTPSMSMTASVSGSVAISVMGNFQIPSVMHCIFSVMWDLEYKRRF